PEAAKCRRVALSPYGEAQPHPQPPSGQVWTPTAFRSSSTVMTSRALIMPTINCGGLGLSSWTRTGWPRRRAGTVNAEPSERRRGNGEREEGGGRAAPPRSNKTGPHLALNPQKKPQ